MYFGQFIKGELRDKKLVEFSIKSCQSLSRQRMLTFLCPGRPFLNFLDLPLKEHPKVISVI